VADIDIYLGVHVSTILKWWSQYESESSAALVQKARGRQLGDQQRLSTDQQQQLQAAMLSGCREDYGIKSALWTRRVVQALIAQQCGIAMPIRTVGDYLKRWDYSPQKPLKRAYEQDPDAVATWLDDVYSAIEARAKAEGGHPHWKDESGLCSDQQRGRSYSTKGQTPSVPHSVSSRKRVNYIASISKNGTVRFMLYTGRFDGPLYLCFLKRFISRRERKAFFIVDRHSVHTRRSAQAWLSAHKEAIEVFYLPPCSPQLNPVEYLNNDVKQQVHDKPPTMSMQPLKRQTVDALARLQQLPSIVNHYFKHPAIACAA